MQLYFVRHGESEANLAHEFSNRGFKHPLTPRGVGQAHDLAKRLSKLDIQRIYSSPLQRAVQTAEILASQFGFGVTTTPALCEWDVGIYEGTRDPQGWELHYQVQLDWFFAQKWESRLPEGESFLDIQARFLPFINELVQAFPNDNIVLVGHGGLYHAMLPHILCNVDYTFVRERPLDNTSYVLAKPSPDGLVGVEWAGIRL